MSVPLSILLLLQASADPIVAVQAPSPVGVAADVAVILMALSVAGSLTWAVFFLRRRLAALEGAVRSASDRFVDRAGPLIDRSRDVADNIEFITRAVRTDVEHLNASVRALTERLNHASDRMEERIEEFNALIEVVQSEAEEIFIDTASTVRGVTAGARAIPKSDGSRRRADETAGGLDRAGANASVDEHPMEPDP
jgi:methyl-accepting chemotaxis protein